MPTESHNDESQNRPTVSVVITAYNAAPFITEALDSVLAQTFKDFEIIVVNDGSPDTDRLEQVLKPYRDRIEYIFQENKGTGAARNTGIRASQGRFISLLDGDDLWDSQYLELQMRLMETEPMPAVVYCDALHFGDGETAGRTFMEVCPSEGEVTFESLLLERCNVMVSATIRREALQIVDCFDEDRSIMGADDFDLWLRMVKRGMIITYHRRPLVRRRMWKGQLSSQLIRFYTSILRVFDKIEQTMLLTGFETELLKGRQQYYRAMLSLLKGKEALTKRNMRAARDYFIRANVVLRRQKIDLVIWLCRYFPWVFYITPREFYSRGTS